MTINARHGELVDAVNAATTHEEHRLADARLRAWREGVFEALGLNECERGARIMAADRRQMRMGHDHPMCGGVWLDWMPADKAAKGDEG